MSKHWKLIDSEKAFDHKWFKVRKEKVELPNGKIIDDYFIWDAHDFVNVFTITKDKKIVMVKQYKHAAKDVLLEFPAGFIDEGETPEETAKRELKEETGYEAEEFTLLSSLMDNPTKQDGHTHIILAKNCEKKHEPSFDDHEDIETVLLTKEELLEKIHSGEIYSTASVACAMLGLKKLGLFSP